MQLAMYAVMNLTMYVCSVTTELNPTQLHYLYLYLLGYTVSTFQFRQTYYIYNK